MVRRQRSSKVRVALFGGSFDPITSSHLKMAAEVIHTDAADEVWFVPCGYRSDKIDLMSAKDRYTMCQLAVTTTFSANFPIHVCDEEVYLEEALTTPELLARLTERNGMSVEFSFVLGSNLLTELKDWDPLQPEWWESARLIVVPRPGFAIPTKYEEMNNVVIVGNNNLPMNGGGTLVSSEVNSSLVRDRMVKEEEEGLLEGGWSIQGLVPMAVNGYIQRYNLYRGRD